MGKFLPCNYLLTLTLGCLVFLLFNTIDTHGCENRIFPELSFTECERRSTLLDQSMKDQMLKEQRSYFLSKGQINWFEEQSNRALLEQKWGREKYNQLLKEARIGNISKKDLDLLMNLGMIHAPNGVSVPTFILELLKISIKEWSEYDEKKRLKLECKARIARYRQSAIPYPNYCIPQ